MSIPLPPILVVDDERNMRLSLESILTAEGYRMEGAASAEQGLNCLSQGEFFMVITDARLTGMNGYDFLGKVKAQRPDLPILMITAYATPKLAVEAIKAGALDYLAKPFAPEELLLAVARCAERYRLLRENETLRARATEAYSLARIIGDSPRMVELRQLVETIAPTNATVLILGESGTGKELIAGALHSLSRRRHANYTRINCAAIPENLLESELFGHEKGAFTGALKQKLGRVEEADGGTIFLDEIGDMSRSLQAKLLRFLEDGTFTRVGGNEELKVDVRIIAATNRDIVEAIRQNQFREDLFHRLNVVQFRPPPLRERGEDIVLLAEHFLKNFSHSLNKPGCAFSPAARQKLLAHHWPGNVRELRNAIERAVILETKEQIRPESLPDFEVEARLNRPNTEPPSVPGAQTLEDAMNQYERELIMASLERHHYNLTRAAEQLKISRHSLRYRMNRLNISSDALLEDEPPPGPLKELARH
ncbi:MAG: sigma-54-dependent Fis family transcriptional regulator [Verrucomicrobia bacterium]|nr:sigma-54-dependent Fis family transcriptional regulator [Verrucomicrobiota bacterium]